MIIQHTQCSKISKICEITYCKKRNQYHDLYDIHMGPHKIKNLQKTLILAFEVVMQSLKLLKLQIFPILEHCVCCIII